MFTDRPKLGIKKYKSETVNIKKLLKETQKIKQGVKEGKRNAKDFSR